MVRHGAHIQEAFRRRKQASKSLNGSLKRGWSDSNDTLNAFETVLLVCLPIMSKALLLIRMWLGYVSTITLRILPLKALWSMGSIHAAAQLQISHYEDGMHLLDSCSKICIVGGYFSGTLQHGWMGDNSEFLGGVLGLLLVFSLFHYYIIYIRAWRAALGVHDVGINCQDVYFWEGIVAAIGLGVWLSCNW